MITLFLCIAMVIGGGDIVRVAPVDVLELPINDILASCGGNGCYFKANGTQPALILIRDDWKEQIGPHTDTMIHELTHHVQAMQHRLNKLEKHEREGEAEYAERAVPVHCEVPWRG